MNKPFTSLRIWLCSVVLAVPVAVLAASPTPRTYQVVTGDTLDKVIRKTMPDSPLRPDVLRNAFIQKNPQAFTKSTPRALMAGVVLNVPNHDELLRSFMAPSAQSARGYANADTGMNERKNWVRFP